MTPAATSSPTGRGWIPLLLTFAMLLLGAVDPVSAQLAGGTYTIGGTSPNYATVDAALAATASGISGPVTFLIRTGTYTSPSTGWYLYSRAGMSSTNTVTIRPDVGATVTLTGSVSSGGVVRISDGDYYTIDGSNVVGGTTRNMTILNSGTSYGSAVVMTANADYNTVRNCVLMGQSPYASTSGGAVVTIYGGSAGGSDYNTVQNCAIGDANGVYRSSYGAYIYGFSTSVRNVGNRITGCDIVNFGSTTTATSAYGIYVMYYNDGTVIERNRLRMTAPHTYPYVYGIFVNEYYGYSRNTRVDGNRISNLMLNMSYWGYGYYYGIYYNGSYGANTNFQYVNNMQTFAIDGSVYAYPAYFYIAYSPAAVACTLNINNNTTYIGGTATSGYTTYGGMYIYGYDGTSTNNYVISHRNNIYDINRGSAYCMYVQYIDVARFTSDYNIYGFTQVSGGLPFIYQYNSTPYQYNYHSTLAQWQSAAARDVNSLSARVPYVSVPSGDLHIAGTCAAFVGESRGTPIAGLTLDADGETRSSFRPDVGADEGDFNGDGIRVTAPVTGTIVTSSSQMPVSFTTNRPLGVRIEISTSDGGSWTTVGTVAQTAVGPNAASVKVPHVATTAARIRVTSSANSCETHSSPLFTIAHPQLTILSPNGGETLVPTDTAKLTWSARNLAPGMTVDLQLSTDNGSTWAPVATGISSQNQPSLNSSSWIVPNAPSKSARLRLVVSGRTEADTTDAAMTIVPQPMVRVLTPNGGESFDAGTEQMIRWEYQTTEYVGVDYSIDGGSTWRSIAARVPAFIGGLSWLVPKENSGAVLVRVVDRTRPRFRDASDAFFTIGVPELRVLSPNGGEEFMPGEEVTVRWQAFGIAKLRVEYSSDNGGTWNTVAPSVEGAGGSFSFVPPAIPTRLAAVRVVSLASESVSDRSDAPFVIMTEKSLVLSSPAAGERLQRGSSGQILWESQRIEDVRILYSSDGGATWQTIVASTPAILGSAGWTVPSMPTETAKIRIQEVGGSLYAESGLFAVENDQHPRVTVTSPNGGESYLEGELMTVTWTSTDVQRLSVAISIDGGKSWTTAGSQITASAGQFRMTAPAPATRCRVRVSSSSPSASDISDGDFTITRRISPKVTLLAPNGGERLTQDSTIEIRWNAVDVAGDVRLSYTTDNGSTWSVIGTAAASAARHAWNVPVVATSAKVRVAAVDGSAGDESDAPFAILERQLPPIVVRSPNNGENWRMGTTQEIVWSAPEQVTTVRIELSVDGGTNWQELAGSIASQPGIDNRWNWVIPVMPKGTIAGLIRVTNGGNSRHFDISDRTFTISNEQGAGVDDEVVAGRAGAIGVQPNPFAGSCELRWNLSAPGTAHLRLLSVRGEVVAEQAIGRLGAGEQRVRVAAGELPDGLYYCEIRTETETLRGTLLLMR